jgi:hypothetical protein
VAGSSGSWCAGATLKEPARDADLSEGLAAGSSVVCAGVALEEPAREAAEELLDVLSVRPLAILEAQVAAMAALRSAADGEVFGLAVAAAGSDSFDGSAPDVLAWSWGNVSGGCEGSGAGGTKCS